MPYKSVAELPDAVKKLSEKKQKQFLAAFNSAHSKYGDEKTAFQVAWSSVSESKVIDLSDAVSDLEEAFGSQPAIDEAAGVIRNVVLLTGNKVSGNNTKYLDSALNEAATRYEGAKMYLDHPLKEELASRRGNRSVKDMGGVYKNVRREGDKVKGDLHVMEHHRGLVMGIAKARPVGTGLSIRDQGIVKEEPGTKTLLVEGFKKGASYSVDLVTEASVNTDLFESTSGGEDDMDFSKLTKEDLAKNRPDLLEAVKVEANAEMAKQLEEAKARGDKGEGMLQAALKLSALCEAGLKPELHEIAKASINPGAVTLEEAKGIIAKFKEMEAKLAAAPKGQNNADPKVKGVDTDREKLEEGVKELPSDDQFAAAFGSRY